MVLFFFFFFYPSQSHFSYIPPSPTNHENRTNEQWSHCFAACFTALHHKCSLLQTIHIKVTIYFFYGECCYFCCQLRDENVLTDARARKWTGFTSTIQKYQKRVDVSFDKTQSNSTVEAFEFGDFWEVQSQRLSQSRALEIQSNCTFE